MARIDMNTILQDTEENPFIGRDPAELDRMLRAAKAQKAREQAQQAIETTGQALQTQQGFVTDPQTGQVRAVPLGTTGQPDKKSELNELIQLEKLKSQKEFDVLKKREFEQKLKKGEIELKSKEDKAKEDARKRGLIDKDKKPGEKEIIEEPKEVTPITAGKAPLTAPPTKEAVPVDRFEEVITGFDPEGVPETKVQERPEVVAEREIEEFRKKKRQEQLTKLTTGKRISATNLEKVVGGLSDLDRIFAAGHERGEIGSLAAKTKFAIAKKVGGRFQDEFPNASKFPGKVAEVLFNMIPMLTQQGEKAGSVRIMRSVLRLLGQTLPDLGTGLEAGRGQMEASIRSFFRFARAAELSGLEFEKEFADKNLTTFEDISEDELTNWVAKIQRVAGRVLITGEEEEALSNLTNTALSASGSLLEKRSQQQPSGTQELQSIDDELRRIDEELGG